MTNTTTSRTRGIGFIGVSTSGGAGYHGGSWATKSHVPYLQSDRNSSYKIVALQNSSKASAERALSAFKLDSDVQCYDDPTSLANDTRVDIVAVSVKVPSHYEPVKAALDAGKDIFVEWPLARNLADAEELTRIAQQKKLKTLVGLQARHNPSIVAVKNIVDSGELGEILGSRMHGYGMIGGAQSNEEFLYGSPIEAGANLLTIPFGHAVDALCWVLGEWEYVSATLANRRPTFDVVDGKGKVVGQAEKTTHDFVSVNGVLQKSGGVVDVVYEGGNNPDGKSPGFLWQINGTQGSVVLEADQGHVQMWQPKVRFGKVGEELKEVAGVKWVGGDFSYAIGQAWEAFAGKVAGHVTTFEDALVRHKMIDAIYRSNEIGSRVKYV